MKTKVHITVIYEATLERAFKTPMLCDVTKLHTGYGLMPKIIDVVNDSDWGKPGSSKGVIAAKSISFKGGLASTDHVLARVENDYWHICVDDFQAWMLGLYKFEGIWETTQLEKGRVQVDYTYHLHANQPLFYPFVWLFSKLFWKRYMVHVTENIRSLIANDEPYMYN